MDEIKRRTGAVNRPLVGSIVKPKTGMSPEDLKKVCLELVRGGVDFIKEDEILGNPVCCPFEARVGLVAAAVREEAAKQKREVFYAPCINGDYPSFLHKARRAVELGATAVHLNIWAGLPAYRALRDLDLNVAIFFQKSGDKVITCGRHNYAIAWPVVTQLARMMGVDFIHAGMWGGYLSDPKDFLDAVLMTLRARGPFKRTVPSFSCGSHPGLAPTTVKHFGSDLMMSSGAGIHGHPDGTTAGAMAMRQAVELAMEGGDFLAKAKTRPELRRAIEKWGCVDE
jgi:ribulose-bisphosphate carboxylase large chain